MSRQIVVVNTRSSAFQRPIETAKCAQFAGLAAAGDLDEVGSCLRRCDRGCDDRASRPRSRSIIDRLSEQLGRRIAERCLGGAVHPVMIVRSVSSGDDRVPCGIHDRVVARVLPVAQHALARDCDRDVTHLQQAANRLAGLRSAGRRYCGAGCCRQHRCSGNSLFKVWVRMLELPNCKRIVDGGRQACLQQIWKQRKQRSCRAQHCAEMPLASGDPVIPADDECSRASSTTIPTSSASSANSAFERRHVSQHHPVACRSRR